LVLTVTPTEIDKIHEKNDRFSIVSKFVIFKLGQLGDDRRDMSLLMMIPDMIVLNHLNATKDDFKIEKVKTCETLW